MERPKVILNCAVSSNGCLAGPDRRPLELSGPEDWQRVHQLRADCDAILVGAETVRRDDPSLRVKAKYAQGPDPLRIVLCASGNLPAEARVFDGTAPTLVVTDLDAPTLMSAQQLRVATQADLADLPSLLEQLGALGIRSILVEGGERVLRGFLASDTWDELTVYVAAQLVEGDAPRLWVEGPHELGLVVAEESLGAGRLLRFSRE